MRNPSLYALCAAMCFGVTEVIIKHKLANISPFFNMALISIPLFIGSALIISYKIKLGEELIFPTMVGVSFILLCGIIDAVAYYFYFGGYNLGGSILGITIPITLVPVFASFFNYIYTGKVPSLAHVISYLLASAAVVVTVMAESSKTS